MMRVMRQGRRSSREHQEEQAGRPSVAAAGVNIKKSSKKHGAVRSNENNTAEDY